MMTYSRTYAPRPAAPPTRGFLILLLLAALACVSIATLLRLNAQAAPRPVKWPSGHQVIYNPDHTVLRHGDEGLAVRKCLEDKGPYQTWTNKAGDWFFVCQLPDGRWGTLFADKIKRALYRENSSYVIGDGTWDKFAARMARELATRFTGLP